MGLGGHHGRTGCLTDDAALFFSAAQDLVILSLGRLLNQSHTTTVLMLIQSATFQLLMPNGVLIENG